MSNLSLVYRHIAIYRFIMNILYLGKYKKRFSLVIDYIKDLPPNAQILELCFGDIYIARYCKRAGHHWKGIDINEHFVNQAKKLGFEAYLSDLFSFERFPKANICIMMGSFYHFHHSASQLLSKMVDSSNTIVISEPISNLSSNKGVIGFFARRTANAGKGNEEFRYNKTSLLAMLEENSKSLNYRIASVQDCGKDLIVKLIKN